MMIILKYFITGALLLVAIALFISGVAEYLSYIENPKRPLWMKIIFTCIILSILCIVIGAGVLG